MTNDYPLTDEDKAEAEKYKVLGPHYFMAKRWADKIINTERDEKGEGQLNSELIKIATEFASKAHSELATSLMQHLISDAEINLQTHIRNAVDSAVNAIMLGEEWACNYYGLSQGGVRKLHRKIFETVGEEMLTEENRRLRIDLADLQRRFEAYQKNYGHLRS